MELKPDKIYKNFFVEKIDKNSAIKQLIALIENSNNAKVRFDSIKYLAKIGPDFDNFDIKEEIFVLFENLLISDYNENIRNAAAFILKENFLEKSLNPMKWVLHHEESPLCLKTIYETIINIIKNLETKEDRLSKLVLIHEIKQIDDKDFKIGFENLNYSLKEEKITPRELSDVLINYYTLIYLKRSIWRLKYTYKNCMVLELDFSFKGLTKIPKALKNLKYLKKLNLKYNQLIKIPKWIQNLKFLENLNLNINNINYLPDSLGILHQLKELFFWKNEIQVLPNSICNLNSLEILNLRLNQLIKLPNNFGNLIKLKELDLHDNKLKFLPNTFYLLGSLEKLNLSWNLLKAIPNSIGSLYSLKVLDLKRNELSNIPPSIGELSALETLDLSDNKLETIPDTIGLLKSLKYLNLSRNNLKFLPESLADLSLLEEIYLGDNILKKIPNGLKKLEEKELIIKI